MITQTCPNVGKDKLIEKLYVKEKLKIEWQSIKLTLKISITKRPVTFIVDTGSMITLLSEEIIKPETMIFPNRRIKIYGIAGVALQTMGATFGRIELENQLLCAQFHVIDKTFKLQADGLLGMDFLDHWQANLNLFRDEISLLLPPYHDAYDPQNGSREKLIERGQNDPANPFLSDQAKDKYYFKDGDTKPQLPNDSTSKREEFISGFRRANIGKENSQLKNADEITLISSEELPDDHFFPNNGKRIFKIEVNNQDIMNYARLHNFYETNEPQDIIYEYYNEGKQMNTLKTATYRDEERRIDYILSNLNTGHCNDDERKLIQEACSKYHDIFHLEGDKLTYTDVLKHRIHIKPGTAPIFTRQYRLPETQRIEVNRQLKEMIESGIIEPSNSAWNSPIMLTKKKPDGSGIPKFRLVVDFKRVNDVTFTQTFPIPLIDEILDDLCGCKYFSTMDLHGAFHQILLHEDDRDFTSFSAGNFKYRWVRMPMGLSAAPLTWQRAINTIFADMLGTNLHIYLDDLLIATATIEEHVELLHKIMQRLRDYNLKLKIAKCSFFRKEVEYLGHIVSADGCKADPRKISCIQNYPQPKNVVQTQRFLGMCNYYRRYIKDFAKKAKPLYNLCKRDQPFIWSDKCKDAFEDLKTKLISSPILIFPNFQNTFIITTDASNYAVGAVLSQGDIPKDRPIQYFSKTLNDAQTRYSTIEKELLAIILAVEAFRHYIYGREFLIVTDHKPLCFLFNHKNISSRIYRWKMALIGYNFKVQHRSGSLNNVADALSRIYEPKSLEEIVGSENMDTECRAITRSKQKQTGEKIKFEEAYHIDENNQLLLNPKEYDHIFFIFTDSKCEMKNKLEEKLASPLDIPNEENPQMHLIDNKRSATILGRKIQNDREITRTKLTIQNILTTSMKNNFENIAINIDFKTAESYFNFKRLFKQIFKCSTIRTTIYLNKIIEITLIDDINEILTTYHKSLLGGHVGYDRMKNNIQRFYHWPTMTTDIKKYVTECEICEKTKINKHTKCPMQITSTGDKIFDHVYIDFVGPIDPPSSDGHKYIFTATCDLTKYVVAVPTYDITALTTAQVFVENIILRFNIPRELTSDNGSNFTAELFKQTAKLLKIKRINTTAYHPQANMVERYHRTLNSYLRAFTQKNPDTWHSLLPFAIFSYNNTVNSTTGFSPNELTFGHMIELPTKIMKNKPPIYNYENYRDELRNTLFETQKLAKEHILNRKRTNKKQYDKNSNELTLETNDLVLIRAEKKKGKYGLPYLGPYRVEKCINETTVKIRRGNRSENIHKDRLIKATAHYDNPPPELVVVLDDEYTESETESE